MAPIVDGAEGRFGNEVQFVRLKATDRANRPFLDAARLPGHPTVFLFDADGRLGETLFGPVAPERLATAITDALAR
jgi:hypothetical protein